VGKQNLKKNNNKKQKDYTGQEFDLYSVLLQHLSKNGNKKVGEITKNWIW
jgi:hypothetical protein